MVWPPAIAMLVALTALVGCVEAASAQAARSRQTAISRSIPSNGQAVLRKKPPAPHAPTQDEKAWMDRASDASNGGGGGGSGM
jgi:hypothetical protein